MSQLSYAELNTRVVRSLEPGGKPWMVSILLAVGALGMGAFAWSVQLRHGLEWSGINHPISWGVYITNFVFWVGIAHAGTLISAILHLLRAPFRSSIARAAEAMTVFAIMTAGLFPIIHLGRPWFAYWLLPYPNQRLLWINFKSPLVWDVFAVSTYMCFSVAFFILGLIPDLAMVRDESKGLKRLFYGIAALGFRGTNHQWLHHTRGYLLFAAMATPLIFSVSSVVAWDFSVSSLPGWHTTILAPFFVCGAVFSGFAMVLTIMIPLRTMFPGFKEIIRMEHLKGIAKLVVFMSLLMSYWYGLEFFGAYYSGSKFESSVIWYRAFGPNKHLFWMMVVFNSVIPLAFIFERVRSKVGALLVVSLLINVGMWIERFLIVVSSLSHDFVPFTWAEYHFQWAEIWITIGSFGFFALLYLLFVKTMPSVAVFEIKEALHSKEEK